MKSVMDALLQVHGMKFAMQPYRIINKHGVIVQKLHFDLREDTLKAQVNLGFNAHKFKKTSPST